MRTGFASDRTGASSSTVTPLQDRALGASRASRARREVSVLTAEPLESRHIPCVTPITRRAERADRLMVLSMQGSQATVAATLNAQTAMVGSATSAIAATASVAASSAAASAAAAAAGRGSASGPTVSLTLSCGSAYVGQVRNQCGGPSPSTALLLDTVHTLAIAGEKREAPRRRPCGILQYSRYDDSFTQWNQECQFDHWRRIRGYLVAWGALGKGRHAFSQGRVEGMRIDGGLRACEVQNG